VSAWMKSVRPTSERGGYVGVLTMKNRTLETVIRGPTPQTKAISSNLSRFGSQGRCITHPAARQTYKEARWSCIMNMMDARRSWIERSGQSSARTPVRRWQQTATHPLAHKIAAHVEHNIVVAHSDLLEDRLALGAPGVQHISDQNRRWGLPATRRCPGRDTDIQW